MDYNSTAEGNNVHWWTFTMRLYNYLVLEGEDPRVMELPFMTSHPFVMAIAPLVYFFIVCGLLPKIMTGRPEMKLQKTLAVYNTLQVVINTYIVILAIKGGWFRTYSFTCQPVDYSRSKEAMTMVHVFWLFYLSKLADWLDTVFFALRKKYEQITFLHMFHHILMPFICWYNIKFAAGGHSTFLCLCNSFVHVLMYSYYLLAGLGYHKYLWWKKYLTTIQMVQFVIIGVHQGQLFFIECDYPWFPQFWTLVWAPMIFALFFNYYTDTYVTEKEKFNLWKHVVAFGERMACFTVFEMKSGRVTNAAQKISATSDVKVIS